MADVRRWMRLGRRLVWLELLLYVLEPVFTGGGVTLQQPPGGQQLQRRASLRLQETVVKISGHAHALLERPGLLQPTQQVQSVEAICGESSDELAHRQLVERQRGLVEAEQAAAHQFAVERP